jgi:hypothetical protein
MPPSEVPEETFSDTARSLPSRRLLGPAVKIIRAFFRTGDVVLLEEQGEMEFGPIVLARGPSVKHFLEDERPEEVSAEAAANRAAGEGDGVAEVAGPQAKRSRTRNCGGAGGAGATVSGNNRRRERERFNRAVKEITDVWRVDDDGEDVAVDTRAVLKKYKPRFDYLLLKQGLTVSVDRASTIVRMADAVGGPKAMWDWRVVLDYWRAKGRLISVGSAQPATGEAAPTPSQAAATYMLGQREEQGPSLRAAVDGIWTMYQATERTESCGLIHRIHERLRLAALYEQYQMACQMVDGRPYPAILHALAKNERLKASSVAKEDMFRHIYVRQLMCMDTGGREWGQLLYEGKDGGQFREEWLDIMDSDHAKLERGRFERRLKRGGRWSAFTALFGRFALTMVPGDVVNDTWVYKCTIQEWNAFLGLVKEFSPGLDMMRRNGYLINRLLHADLLPGAPCGLERIRSVAGMEGMGPDERFRLLRFDLEEGDMDGAFSEDMPSQRVRTSTRQTVVEVANSSQSAPVTDLEVEDAEEEEGYGGGEVEESQDDRGEVEESQDDRGEVEESQDDRSESEEFDDDIGDGWDEFR